MKKLPYKTGDHLKEVQLCDIPARVFYTWIFFILRVHMGECGQIHIFKSYWQLITERKHTEVIKINNWVTYSQWLINIGLLMKYLDLKKKMHWSLKTILTLPFFMEMSVPSQESEHSCVCYGYQFWPLFLWFCLTVYFVFHFYYTIIGKEQNYFINSICLQCIKVLFNYLTFQFFDFERTWWRLFQKCVLHTKSDIFVFIIIMDNTKS